MKIPFNVPLNLIVKNKHISKVLQSHKFSGDGQYNRYCGEELEKITGCLKAILTPSCTAALEMSALLSDIKAGDEIIMPSYTYVTTASAFVLRGAKIVWCDIRYDTKNIDEKKIETLITEKTKAIVVVHYAGVACEMDYIKQICQKYDLILIEDAAQAIDSYYKNKPLGSFGDFATLSFHETKNVQCGEGGALLINNPDMVEKAQIIRDKGTNRIHFDQGIVDKYTWVELGSSFLMSELQAAFLLPQLIDLKRINDRRRMLCEVYNRELSDIIPQERLPFIPEHCKGNGHIFYMLTFERKQRNKLLDYLKERQITAVFHYVPLHLAPFWKGKYSDLNLEVTQEVSDTLIRLPLFYDLTEKQLDFIIENIRQFYRDM